MQMLLVAFSRRMCCSRVWSASRSAGRPAASTETPTSRPGRLRLYSSRVAMNAACGPPNPSGTPKRCDEPTTTSAPCSPGGTTSVSANRSVATATSAPCAWSAAISSVRSRTTPLLPGSCSSTPKIPDGSMSRSASPTTTSSPSGSALVRTTAMVCGWQSASTKNRVALLGADPMEQRHGFRGCGGLVEQRRVGELHPGEVAHHGLEVQERLEPALRDLRLVRGVRRVPRGVLEHVALDDRRRDRVGVSQAEQRRVHLDCGLRASEGGPAPPPRCTRGSSASVSSRIALGTARATSSSRESRPSTSSIECCSVASGPTWRSTNCATRIVGHDADPAATNGVGTTMAGTARPRMSMVTPVPSATSGGRNASAIPHSSTGEKLPLVTSPTASPSIATGAPGARDLAAFDEQPAQTPATARRLARRGARHARGSRPCRTARPIPTRPGAE